MRYGDGQIPIIWGQIDCGGNDTTTENDSFVKSYQVNKNRRKQTPTYQIYDLENRCSDNLRWSNTCKAQCLKSERKHS